MLNCCLKSIVGNIFIDMLPGSREEEASHHTAATVPEHCKMGAGQVHTNIRYHLTDSCSNPELVAFYYRVPQNYQLKVPKHVRTFFGYYFCTIHWILYFAVCSIAILNLFLSYIICRRKRIKHTKPEFSSQWFSVPRDFSCMSWKWYEWSRIETRKKETPTLWWRRRWEKSQSSW